MKTKIFFTTLLTVFNLSASAIDYWIEEALEALNIPGAAVAVVANGEIALAKGYGIRSTINPLPVTENTVFAIASATKAFTALAIGKLVEEGKLSWDDSVITHIPEFRLSDIYATHHITIRDLLSHRSGMPRHEMMWYRSKFPRAELLKRLPALPLTTDLRERFQYNNLMYTVAGIVIERVAGQTWEEFIQEKVFSPLHMEHSRFSGEGEDVALPHQKQMGQVVPVEVVDLSNMGPAVSIYSSAHDMANWLLFQLSGEEILEEMHTIHTALSNSAFDASPYLFGYGLGWCTGFYKGDYIAIHDGTLDGFLSCVLLFPKKGLGVAVLINTDQHEQFPENAAFAIADFVMEQKEIPSVEVKKEEEEEEDDEEEHIPLIYPMTNYVGEFYNNGYGTVEIYQEEEKLIALYNGIEYTLEHRGHGHFQAVSAAYGFCLSAFFFCDQDGEINQFYLHTEPSLGGYITFFRQKD